MRRFLIVGLSVILVGSAAAIGAPPRRQAASEKPSRAEAFAWLRNAFMQTSHANSAKYKYDNRPEEIVVSSTPLRFQELRECVVSMETETRFSGALKSGR